MSQSPKKLVPPSEVPASVLAKFLGLESVEDLEAARAQGWVPEKDAYLALLHFFALKKEAADARKARRRAAEKARRDRRGLQILEAALALIAAWRKVDESRHHTAIPPIMWYYPLGYAEAKAAARKAARKAAEDATAEAEAEEDARWRFGDDAVGVGAAAPAAPTASAAKPA